MKKKLLASALALVLIFAFCMVSACSLYDIKGTYYLYKFESNIAGTEISVNFDGLTDEEKELYEDIILLALEFTEDEVIMYNGEVETDRGKYKMDGTKVIPLDDDGNEEPMEMDGIIANITFSGGRIIMEGSMTVSGITMTMKYTFKKK